ncbi:chorismate mutase [Aeribacillus pallidus]|jgi:chorismate mutase|uniref:chorismate mutase n=1 Tax=Aeribacillus pallidus TaxID=33936 RepID=UPI001D74D278|nr:chorismate mutase [Bacillus sp. (in: firmicutes)]
MIRGIRGAITADDNSEQSIVESTLSLLRVMIKENDILPEEVASVFISATPDLNASFPAKALRSLEGWTFVPVMCMQEMPVPHSLEKCIRVMIHVNTSKKQEDIHHVYLKGAKHLRPDLNRT